MSQEIILELSDFLFRAVRYPTTWKDDATDAKAAELFGRIMDIDVSGKADKVTDAVANNLAALDENGNLIDAGKRVNELALRGHNHDGRYVMLDGDVTYDSVANTWTFTVDDGAPFAIDNTSGDPLAVVTHLNADKLDGYDATAFALANHSHNKYVLIGQAQEITGLFTFHPASGAPFAIHASNQGQKVTGLNADQLDGLSSADFAAASHNHDDVYYTEDEIDAKLALKLDVPNTSAADGEILVWNDGDGVLERSGVDLSDLATVTALATKYDEISATNGNFASFGSSGAVLADSGVSASSFVTVTNIANYSITAKLDKDSTVDSDGNFIVGSNNSNGAGTTAGGTLEVLVNGSTYYLLTSATP